MSSLTKLIFPSDIQQQQKRPSRGNQKTPKKPTTPLLLRTSTYNGRTASAIDASPIAQSARKKLQYSQLPIRNDKKLTTQLSSSLKKFPVIGAQCKRGSDKTCDVTANVGKKKSISMIDLTSVRRKKSEELKTEEKTSRSNGSTSARQVYPINEPNDVTLERWPGPLHKDENLTRVIRSAGIICRVLAVNAWRRRKRDINVLRVALADVNQQVDHLQLQIVVLRKLLDKENTRVVNLAGELQRTKNHGDEIARERDRLIGEKEAAIADALKEHDIVEEQTVTVENLRNELNSARDQIDTLDKQIARDREKLLKIREEKKHLEEKLAASDALAEEIRACADKAELACEDTQLQLATQLAVTSSLQEELQRCSSQIDEKEEQRNELEITISGLVADNERLVMELCKSEENEITLRERVEYFEGQLDAYEIKLKRIEAECDGQIIELNQLRDHFFRESQKCGWSSRVLQLAGSFVRAPSVILRTITFFTSSASLIF